MMKTILKFLIALIVPSTLTVIYIFSEKYIVKSLSTDSTGELSRTLLRSGLGVSSGLIIALSYWICDLREKLKILEKEKKANETPTFIKVNQEFFTPSTTSAEPLPSEKKNDKILEPIKPSDEFTAAFERLMKLSKPNK